jgi:threonine dehydratase
MHKSPSLSEIKATAQRLAPHLVHTPTVPFAGCSIEGLDSVSVFMKLELLQHTGSFKPRGALNAMMALPDDVKGVTAFSAGNHAIATAFAASKLGLSAKVVMPETANAYRVECCKAYGAEIVFGQEIADLIAIVEELKVSEQRALIHPFEGPHTVAGTATVGLELSQAVPDLDAVLVPIGGGGLMAGVASAIKQLQPKCTLIGVEPTGADGMSQSIDCGKPVDKVQVSTIADSLGAPMHTPYAFGVVQRYVDELVQVSDEQLRDAMRCLFVDAKLAVEPACAATYAALKGPLKGRFTDGQRIAIIACGSNIDLASYQRIVS